MGMRPASIAAVTAPRRARQAKGAIRAATVNRCRAQTTPASRRPAATASSTGRRRTSTVVVPNASPVLTSLNVELIRIVPVESATARRTVHLLRAPTAL